MLKVKHADYLGEGIEWIINEDKENQLSVVGEFLVFVENDEQLHTALCEFNTSNRTWELKELIVSHEEEFAVLCDHEDIMKQIEHYLQDTLPLKTQIALLEMEEFSRKAYQ